MDRNEEKDISIRVNGKDRPVSEKKEAKNEKTEIAASIADDAEETPFEWVLPKENTASNVYLFHANRDDTKSDEYGDHSYESERKPGLPIHRKKQRTPLNKKFPSSETTFKLPKQLLVPIGSAIVIGCIIGLIVLMIFTGDGFQSKTAPVANDTPKTPVQNPISSPVAGSVDLSISPHIVQGGVFSSLENAEEFADKVKASGFAAAVDPEDNRVIIGIGDSMEDVRGLAGDYQEVVADAYPRQWEIGGSDIAISEKNDYAWLVEGKDLLAGLFTTQEVQEETILAWKKEALTSLSNLEGEQQKSAVAFINALSSLTESGEDKWVVQQAKLEALIHYKTLVESL
ncbi:hypothetical protein ACSVDE_10710 [Pseudalkalibacillus sp. Hm43]|uniref:hypothetical protein n=1 Tax=Pseudalkalibacillus sp. Hm43 TaxID=3450742 RepID=UPI003F440E44